MTVGLCCCCSGSAPHASDRRASRPAEAAHTPRHAHRERSLSKVGCLLLSDGPVKGEKSGARRSTRAGAANLELLPIRSPRACHTHPLTLISTHQNLSITSSSPLSFQFPSSLISPPHLHSSWSEPTGSIVDCRMQLHRSCHSLHGVRCVMLTLSAAALLPLPLSSLCCLLLPRSVWRSIAVRVGLAGARQRGRTCGSQIFRSIHSRIGSSGSSSRSCSTRRAHWTRSSSEGAGSAAQGGTQL